MAEKVDASTSPLYGRKNRKPLSSSESYDEEQWGGCEWGSSPYFECHNEIHKETRNNCNVWEFLKDHYEPESKSKKNKKIYDFSTSEEEYQILKKKHDKRKSYNEGWSIFHKSLFTKIDLPEGCFNSDILGSFDYDGYYKEGLFSYNITDINEYSDITLSDDFKKVISNMLVWLCMKIFYNASKESSKITLETLSTVFEVMNIDCENVEKNLLSDKVTEKIGNFVLRYDLSSNFLDDIVLDRIYELNCVNKNICEYITARIQCVGEMLICETRARAIPRRKRYDRTKRTITEITIIHLYDTIPDNKKIKKIFSDNFYVRWFLDA